MFGVATELVIKFIEMAHSFYFIERMSQLLTMIIKVVCVLIKIRLLRFHSINMYLMVEIIDQHNIAQPVHLMNFAP